MERTGAITWKFSPSLQHGKPIDAGSRRFIPLSHFERPPSAPQQIAHADDGVRERQRGRLIPRPKHGFGSAPFDYSAVGKFYQVTNNVGRT